MKIVHLADGATHARFTMTGPLDPKADKGTFKWSLDKPISQAQVTSKKVKGGHRVTISFLVAAAKEQP